MSEIFRALEAFAFTGKSGLPRIIRPGDLVSSDDPDFAGREHLFETVSVAAARGASETTTAAPGEVRASKRPAAPHHKAASFTSQPEGDEK